ncbi:MAG: hypothetical protein IKR61_03600, partial [Lachnospiraceae bacterium]|nr:hypothetical protein [Lachnospiraceae bacterium]
MRKGFMKKMIAAGLALTMVLSLAACGKNGGSGDGSGSGSSGGIGGGGKGDSSSAVSSDPSAAKQGVYKQTAFDLGFSQNDSVSVITSGKLTQGYGFVLRRDSWDETTYTS